MTESNIVVFPFLEKHKINGAMWADRRISKTDGLVMFKIMEHYDQKTGYARISAVRIADDLQIGQNRVWASIKRLRAYKYLSEKKLTNGSEVSKFTPLRNNVDTHWNGHKFDRYTADESDEEEPERPYKRQSYPPPSQKQKGYQSTSPQRSSARGRSDPLPAPADSSSCSSSYKSIYSSSCAGAQAHGAKTNIYNKTKTKETMAMTIEAATRIGDFPSGGSYLPNPVFTKAVIRRLAKPLTHAVDEYRNASLDRFLAYNSKRQFKDEKELVRLLQGWFATEDWQRTMDRLSRRRA